MHVQEDVAHALILADGNVVHVHLYVPQVVNLHAILTVQIPVNKIVQRTVLTHVLKNVEVVRIFVIHV